MHVIATAGHVDHGKSTLVRALTGMEPDRWSEERRRGMTIDLGFAWTTLPSGAQIAFVDVPGHERFMTNMLAGVGPVPVVMFVVAADEGWSVQSGEHLAALDTFGVRHGLIAVTRSDLADPAPVLADATARLARTSLGSVEAVAVDGISGRGVPELRAAIDRLIARLSTPDTEADVRLWVDRAFTITGLGTVVTGTLGAGTIRDGDEFDLLPQGRRVTVRGLESLKRSSSAVPAVARVAVNLRGVAKDEVGRGDVLVTPGKWWSTSLVDARLTSSFTAAELAASLVLHIGSAAVPVRLRPFGDTHLRLRLPRPLPLRIGDVALLRDPAQQLVVGRVTILDVDPPRRGSARVRAAELADYSSTPDGAAEVRRRKVVRGRTLHQMGATPPGMPLHADWHADAAWWSHLQQLLASEVDTYAAANPGDPGLPLEHARQLLGLPDRQLVRALATPPIVHRGGRLFGASVKPVLSPAIATVQNDLRRRPFLAPEADRLAALGLGKAELAAAVRAGELLRVSDGIYLLPDAALAAAQRLSELDGPFTLSQARQLLDTTRRVAVPLLELLDARGLTRRLDDTHRVLSQRLHEARG